jgi:hypothetical protein
MKTRRAGETARGGFYFNAKTWELTLHRKDGDALPGGESDLYVRVPTAALLVLGPAMGFLFVIFLPLIGFALTFRELGHRAAAFFRRATHTPKPSKTAAR